MLAKEKEIAARIEALVQQQLRSGWDGKESAANRLKASVTMKMSPICATWRPKSRSFGLVNQMLVRALESRASDVHIEPFENQLKVRYRIDGILHEVESPPRQLERQR